MTSARSQRRPEVPPIVGATRTRRWQRAYRPLQPSSLAVQLVILVAAEVLLFRSYGAFDSSFHWAAHFLVGVIASAVFLTAYLAIAAAPARGQLIVVLGFHLYAMAPDLLFRTGIPHSTWMNVFLAHIAVHYIPGGDFTWLVLALLAYGGYAVVLTLWLRARATEAALGLVPGIGIGGRAVVRAQLDPRTTLLAHEHLDPDSGPTQPTFVLLHGLGATRPFWYPTAAALAGSGARALVPDLLGYGASLRIGTRFTIADQAEAVLYLLREHQLKAVRIVAHSYGCAVAVEVARRAPHLVADLTLVSPPAFPDAGVARARLSARSWLARRTLAGAPVASAACGVMCLTRAPLARLAPHVEKDVPSAVARGAIEHVFPAYRDGLDTLFTFNPIPGWIDAPGLPTRLVVAEQDATAPPADLADLPGIDRLAVVRHEGTHRLPLEHPGWLAEQLLAKTTDG
jgi:pimeloyl-ACP methyl ester carboxylesterase